MSLNSSSSTFPTQSSFGSRLLHGMVTPRFNSGNAMGEQTVASSGFDLLSRSLESPANGKMTMQNLNDRLATYLERVHSLEQANNKLELQIKEFYTNKIPLKCKDMSGYLNSVSDLCKQVCSRFVQNADLRLKLDNTKLAADDFQIKYENEKHFRTIVEIDLFRLRGVLGEMKLSSGHLENQTTGLKEELLHLKMDHENQRGLRKAREVFVEINCLAQPDLEKDLQEMRVQYEALIEKNRREAEEWFQSKAEVLLSQVATGSSGIRTSQTEIIDLKRTFQNTEIKLLEILTMKDQLEQNLKDVGMRSVNQLSQLQLRINDLQEALQMLNINIQKQSSDYQHLMDIKMRLEMEIAEYRRLLDGDACPSITSTSESSTTMTESKIIERQEDEEHNPHIQRRVKIIVEEIVDGKVISSSVDEKIQEVS